MVAGMGVRGYREVDRSTWGPMGRNKRGINRRLGTREHQSCRKHWLHSEPSWVYCAMVQRFHDITDTSIDHMASTKTELPIAKWSLSSNHL
ncbi:hypothetical protein TIFTF001_025833 [Ficus carica]|uniref:Uncharacterized protein n=1 Tax=Ficus carica TaxID=3494 RepID=A0AA88DHE2_FICCA|nr:hypothetical protein TIFTF001_025833 [Ficus carica]